MGRTLGKDSGELLIINIGLFTTSIFFTLFSPVMEQNGIGRALLYRIDFQIF